MPFWTLYVHSYRQGQPSHHDTLQNYLASGYAFQRGCHFPACNLHLCASIENEKKKGRGMKASGPEQGVCVGLAFGLQRKNDLQLTEHAVVFLWLWSLSYLPAVHTRMRRSSSREQAMQSVQPAFYYQNEKKHPFFFKAYTNQRSCWSISKKKVLKNPKATFIYFNWT